MRAIANSYRREAAPSPRKNSSAPAAGTPKRKRFVKTTPARRQAAACHRRRLRRIVQPPATPPARRPMSTRRSRHNPGCGATGTTPPPHPLLGLSPTRLLNAAGTLPEPAVSVPNADFTSPDATATADPGARPPRCRPRQTRRSTRHTATAYPPDRRKLIQVGLADEHRAGIQQALHRERRALRCVGEGRAARRCRHARHVNVVLHRERYAVQRQRQRRALSSSSARARSSASSLLTRWIQTGPTPCASILAYTASTISAGLAAPAL